jgi:mycothiol synthase
MNPAPSPAGGPTLRPARREDLDAIVELLCACDVAEIGRPDTVPEDVLESWRAPHIDMSTDTCVAAGRPGKVDGYAEITRRPTAGAAVEFDGDFWVRPGLEAGPALAEALLQRVLDRAVEMAAGQDPAHLAVFCAQANPGKSDLLVRHGFIARRRYLRMTIALPSGYAAAPPPAGVRIGDFDPAAHADKVRRLMIAAFSDDFRPRAEPLADWRARLIERPDFDPSFWTLAWESRAGGRPGERLSGAVIAYDFGDLGWVQGLAVAADRRGCGISLALLQEVFARLAAAGQRTVALGVDTGNETGALRLYERAGMRQEQRADLYVRTVREAPRG